MWDDLTVGICRFGSRHWRGADVLVLASVAGRFTIATVALLASMPEMGSSSSGVSLSEQELRDIRAVVDASDAQLEEALRGRYLEFKVETVMLGYESARAIQHRVEVVSVVDSEGQDWDPEMKRVLAQRCGSELVAIAVLTDRVTPLDTDLPGSARSIPLAELLDLARRRTTSFAVTTATVGSVVLGAMLIVWRLSPQWRKARGLCTWCGCNRKGLPDGAPCPECGGRSGMA